MIRFSYLRFALICAYVVGAEAALVNDRCLEAQTIVYEYKVPAGGYNAVGNLTSYSDTINGAWTMVNDPLGRLVTAASTSGLFSGISLAEQYDSFGNRLSQQVSTSGTSQATVPSSMWAVFDTSGSFTCPYSGSNRLCASSTSAASGMTTQLPTDASIGMQNGYDAAGNLISDGVIYARYDAEGRMCASYSTVASGFTQYFYDAEGHRVGKATATAFVCPGALQPATGPVLARYLVGPSGEQVTELDGQNNWVHSNIYAAGSLLATYNQSGMHFPITDLLGSLRVEVSGAGLVDETCANLPFGDGQNCSGTDAIENHFTGKERDGDLGPVHSLDYFGARYFASNMGRFMSPDFNSDSDEIEPVPYANVSNPQSLNLYSYIKNNPLLLRDESGHVPCGGTALVTVNVNSDGTSNMSQSADDCPTLGFIDTLVFHRQQLINHINANVDAYRAPAQPNNKWQALQDLNNIMMGAVLIGEPFNPKLKNTLDSIDKTGEAPPGQQGGNTFNNDGRGGGQVLPSTDGSGNPINYREWDVNTKQPGMNRGGERLVTGSDGSAYSTADHYQTFTRVR